MKKSLCLFICMIPLFVLGQQDLTGLWKLTDRIAMYGPEYDNGVPKVIKIVQSDNTIKLEITNSLGIKDTLEREEIKLDKIPYETITGTQRKKVVILQWNNDKRLWSKEISFSRKNEFNVPDISITETMQLSKNGGELTVIKKYDGPDVENSTKDYFMRGVYERTTSEKLAWESAKGAGITFVEGLSWKEILNRAKKENKYIFVDCYATWCTPCKTMDREVYPLNMVGEIMNDKFISVKVQIDTSKTDDEKTRITYPIARMLEKEYNIQALPSYLFFDPTGTAIHKEIGALLPDKFVLLVKGIKDPSKQIYTLILKSKEGLLPKEKMMSLAKDLDEKKEKTLAREVARNYFDQYLYTLNDTALFSMKHVKFINKFRNVVSSKDRMFKVLLNEPLVADTNLNMPGFAMGIVKSVIITEEIGPNIRKAEENRSQPDWILMKKNIERKYGSKVNGESIIVDMKVGWYHKKKDWGQFCKYLEQQTDFFGDLNKVSWYRLYSAADNMFDYSNDKRQLKKALRWSEFAIKNQLTDTTIKDSPWLPLLCNFGDLLYKLGNKNEAIQYYKEKILSIEPNHPDYLDHFNKMVKGEPSWANIN